MPPIATGSSPLPAIVCVDLLSFDSDLQFSQLQSLMETLRLPLLGCLLRRHQIELIHFASYWQVSLRPAKLIRLPWPALLVNRSSPFSNSDVDLYKM